MTDYTKEAIQPYDRDEAHHFVSFLLRTLPIQQGEHQVSSAKKGYVSEAWAQPIEKRIEILERMY